MSWYLTKSGEPNQRIRCPIHGFIHFSDNEKRIIDHPLFQRLRRIKQLALTDYIYPGAQHTRFEHSLGVMDVATRMFDSIARKQNNEEQLKEVFRQVEGFKEEPIEKARQLLRLAALLHDIGHVCFSHASEHVFFGDEKHENYSIKLIEDTDLQPLLDKIFFQGISKRIAQLVDPDESDLPPQFKLLKDIVSGEMDADRSDYLLRDSLHCGVEYGKFDLPRLIECLEIFEPETGKVELALNQDGIHIFEHLIIARYMISTQVLHHRLRRVYDIYLTKYLEAIKDELNAKEPHEWDDYQIFSLILRDSKIPEGEKGEWASRIQSRSHHKCVFESELHPDPLTVINSTKLLKDLRKNFSDIDFLDDIKNRGSIHKQLTPNSKPDEVEDKHQLMVIGKHGKDPRQIGYASQFLSKMQDQFYLSRIYINNNASEQVQQEVQKFVNDAKGRM